MHPADRRVITPPQRVIGLALAVTRALRFIVRHPLNRRHKARSLARYVAWQVYKRVTGRSVVVSLPTGGRLRVYPDNRMASAVLYTGLPEYDEMLFVSRFLRARETFIDIGANVGSYAVIALAAASDTCVVAYEPHPATFVRLAENIRLNTAIERARLRQSAIGDRVGTISFTATGDATNHIATPGETAPTILVPLTTLDEDLREVGPVAIVKMDVEGAEVLVLTGANRFIRDSRPLVWIVELIDVARRYGLHNEDVVALLGLYGYRPYEYRADEDLLIPFDRHRATGNNALFIADVAMVRDRLARNGHPLSA